MFVAEPDSPATRAVIVIQEAFGITELIENVTQRAAAAGYFSVSPALFHRDGAPVFAYDNFEPVMKMIGTLHAEGLRQDIEATIAFLEVRGFSRSQIGMTGFCMGGSVTFYAATLGCLGAAASIYGGGLASGRFGFPPLIELAPVLDAPWIGFFGDLDGGIPVADVEQLRVVAASSPVPTSIYRYPDAQHGFHCDARPAVFDPAAASDAWDKTLRWFETYLG